MRPTTQKQASKRAEIEVRRHDALLLKIAGRSDREIAKRLGVAVSTAHNDVKNVLEAQAREDAEAASRLRALLNIRLEALFYAYFDRAVGGDVEAAKLLLGIIERIAKINGVIPDRPVIDMRTQTIQVGEGMGLMELARFISNGDNGVGRTGPDDDGQPHALSDGRAGGAAVPATG
jgi:DNA-binding CsgD family transcriptional regulator